MSFTPRPGVQPRTKDGKLMGRFAGKAWISESEYELVRLEVEAIDTVSIGLGLFARIHRGSRLVFERRKVNGEEWLPAVASCTVSARMLLVKRLRSSALVEFSDYRKFSVNTEISTKPLVQRDPPHGECVRCQAGCPHASSRTLELYGATVCRLRGGRIIGERTDDNGPGVVLEQSAKARP